MQRHRKPKSLSYIALLKSANETLKQSQKIKQINKAKV